MRKINFVPILLSTVFSISLTAFHAQALDISDITEYLYPDTKKTISMDFRNAQLNDVLKIFSQQSGLNFIASTSIANKSVNLYLDAVPVDQALERILSANDLTYELNAGGNIFVVKELKRPEKEVVTRVYRLKHTTVPSSKMTAALAAGGDSETSAGTAGSSGTESAGGIVAAVQALLTPDGSVTEDVRTNSIVVSDIPSAFPGIEQTIARLDIRIPQILIEVEMLDISKSTADLIGAKFGNTPIQFNGGQKDGSFPFDGDNIADDNIETHTPGARDAGFAEPRYRVSTMDFSGLSFVLQFLKTQTDTKNLARPRIMTLNNETAEINISTDEAIGLASSTTSSEGTASSVEQAERVQTGVFLTVTPQANVATGEITMAVQPRVIQARTGQTFGNSTFKDPEERGAKSLLRVQDGDTVIIGGLLRTDISETKTFLPWIGEIPILGAPFRHKDRGVTERELVIFITPHILQDSYTENAKQYSNNNNLIVREQDLPSKRQNQINKELSLQKRF